MKLTSFTAVLLLFFIFAAWLVEGDSIRGTIASKEANADLIKQEQANLPRRDLGLRDLDIDAPRRGLKSGKSAKSGKSYYGYYSKSGKSGKSYYGSYYSKSAKSDKSNYGSYYSKSAKSGKSYYGYYSKSAKSDKSYYGSYYSKSVKSDKSYYGSYYSKSAKSGKSYYGYYSKSSKSSKSCKDSASFRANGKGKRSCEWISKKPQTRCILDEDALYKCPSICSSVCTGN
jgi:hypothetical protein